MRRPSELRVNLTESVPIRIAYLTAWADEDGTMQFRDDVYGYDRREAKASCSR
jgi:murein L,D-transpeptidase YcbB/YkuD